MRYWAGNFFLFFFAFKKYQGGVEGSAHIQTLGDVSPPSQYICAGEKASKPPKKVLSHFRGCPIPTSCHTDFG